MNISISHDKTPEEREEGRKIYSIMIKLKNIDPGVTCRKGLFKVRGSFYRLKEMESLINEIESDTNAFEEAERANKKRKAEEKLEKFAYRPRNTSVGQRPS